MVLGHFYALSGDIPLHVLCSGVRLFKTGRSSDWVELANLHRTGKMECTALGDTRTELTNLRYGFTLWVEGEAQTYLRDAA